MFKFLKKLIERLGPAAPMPIIITPVVPSEVVTTPPAIPTIAIGEETAKPKAKRPPRNQPKPSARRWSTSNSSDPK